MSSIAELRAFLGQHKLPKMTSKKSVLMDAAIERGWRPSNIAKNVIMEESEDEPVPVKKVVKKMDTRIEPKKALKVADKPVFKGARTVPAAPGKKAVPVPVPVKKSKRMVEDDE